MIGHIKNIHCGNLYSIVLNKYGQIFILGKIKYFTNTNDIYYTFK